MTKNISLALTLIGLFISTFFMGCGVSSSSSQILNSNSTSLTGTLTDGPISNAKVVLASMKGGKLSQEATTDEDGNYTLRVSNAVINGLSDNDLPYIHAESTENSAVLTSGGQKSDLVKGQVSFRSILAVNQLKTLVSDGKSSFNTAAVELETDEDLQDLARGLTISHVSNAKTLILESKLLAKGVLKTGEQLNPETFSTARSVAETEIEEALVELEAVETDLEIPESETTANLMMLAAVTKEIVEGGNLDIVQSSTETAAKTNAAKFLLEIARESKDLSASFSNKLAGRINEVVADLNTNLKGAFKTSVSDAIKSVDKDKATTALKTDFKIVKEFLAGQFYRLSDAEIGSQKAAILLTYVASGGSDVVTMTVQQTISNQGGTERLLTLFGGTPTIVFSYDDKPTSLSLVSIGSTDINTYIGKLKIGQTNVAAGISLTLSKPTTSVSGSDILSKGRFYSLEVSANNQNFTLVFGSVRTGANKVFPLGVVGIKGLYDTDTMYTLKQASIKGLKFPFSKGSIAEALNEARRESAEGLKAAHQIASALRSSSNVKIKREANLIYAVTNLAMHLNANTGSTKSTLSELLDKLNFMSKGRNIFDFVAKVQEGEANTLVLNDFKGLSDLQNYFAGTAKDTMVAALQRSIEALNIVEVTAKGMLLTDELMKLEWSGTNASFQRKDLYMLKSVFHLLKFAMHFLSANNFDISDAAVTKILESKDTYSGVTSFEDALEYYDSDNNELPEVLLVDILKADNIFLRSRGRIHFSGAKTAFLNTLNEVLGFIQAVESDGGNPHSAFYVAQNELEEIKITKKSLLSFYNNLIQGYHPSITIDGKSGASWYSLAAKAGETLAYSYDSSIRNLGPFDHRYIYNTETSHSSKWDDVTFQYIYTEHLQQSFTKVNLGALFTNSLRDILTGGSVSVSLATSDDQLLESHVSETGNLSALVKSFVPNARFFEFGEEKVVVPEQVIVTSVPVESSVTVTFSLTNTSFHDQHHVQDVTTSVDKSDFTSFRVYFKSYPGESVRSFNLDTNGELKVKIDGGADQLVLHYSSDSQFKGGVEDRAFMCSSMHGVDTISAEISISSCYEYQQSSWFLTSRLVGHEFDHLK